MDRIPEKLRGEITAIFHEYRPVYMATWDGHTPRVRPVTLNLLDGVFYVLTGTGDAKIEQLRRNPRTEMCLPMEKGENTGYVRFAGRVKFVDDPEVKRSVAERVDYFKVYWKGTDDPEYTLLALEVDEVEHMEPGGGEVRARSYGW